MNSYRDIANAISFFIPHKGRNFTFFRKRDIIKSKLNASFTVIPCIG